MIVTLQEDLAKKNVRIQELDEMVASLNEDVEDLSTTTAAQSEKLQEQDKQLHTAYYCFGTAKELKDQKSFPVAACLPNPKYCRAASIKIISFLSISAK